MSFLHVGSTVPAAALGLDPGAVTLVAQASHLPALPTPSQAVFVLDWEGVAGGVSAARELHDALGRQGIPCVLLSSDLVSALLHLASDGGAGAGRPGALHRVCCSKPVAAGVLADAMAQVWSSACTARALSTLRATLDRALGSMADDARAFWLPPGGVVPRVDIRTLRCVRVRVRTHRCDLC